MDTKNPFIHTGLSVQQKFGSRNLSESIIRLAEKFQDKNGEDSFSLASPIGSGGQFT